MNEKITVYSLPTCGKCKVLKMKLQSLDIPYEECQDIEEMQKIGIMSTPALAVGDKLLKKFEDINNWVNSQKKGTK